MKLAAIGMSNEPANDKAASDAAKAERRAKLAAIKKTLSDAKQARNKKENQNNKGVEVNNE